MTSTVQSREVDCDPFQMSAKRVGDYGHIVLASFNRVLQHLLRPRPRDRIEKTALALAHKWFADSVRVVSELNRRVVARALPTSVHRVIRVAGYLLSPPLHNANDQAVSAGHVRPSCCVPSIFATHEVLGHVDRTLDNEFAFRQTAGSENHRASSRLCA